MRQTARNTRQYPLSGLFAPALAQFFAGLLFLCAAPSFAESNIAPDKPPIKDIRVLIDISGSMKKTDPSNLRQPAVKLFSTLLPENVYSGVWTFGQWVNMLVPHGIANSKWKSSARELASQINSSGLFTNIEEALKRSTWDWKSNIPAYERSIIILSDGVVDISKDTEENTQSRTRITTEILPRLAAAGVKIHTIALSTFSDKELLQQLSTVTGGIHETITSPEDLDKIFMHIFDVAAPRDEIPLIDNKVKVDDSIKEITFLLYREKKSSISEIVSPSGDTYKKNKTTDNMVWHSEKRYDLVTIKDPQPGSWKINASTDPDNRVMVITDLRLVINKLPSDVLMDQSIPIYAHLESEEGIIKRKDFLHFVRMSVKYSAESKKKKKKTLKLKDNGKGVDKYKKDGIYSAEIKKSKIQGKNKFELIVNGTTFKRRMTKLINVVEYPVVANVRLTDNNEISVSIVPYLSLLDPEFVQLTAIHTWPDKKTDEYTIPRTSPSEWSEKILTKEINGNHKIGIKVTGSDISGNDLDIFIEQPDIIVGSEEKIPTTPESDPPHDDMHEHSEEETEGWISITFKVLTFNIVLGLLVFAAYRLWIKYKYKLLPNPLEEITNG